MSTHKTKRREIDFIAEETGEAIMVADGFDEAIIGLTEVFRVVYDREKCITALTRNMSREDAEEYFEFNVADAYVGDRTPIFVDVL